MKKTNVGEAGEAAKVRRRRGREEIDRWVASYRASGLKPRIFAEQNGLKLVSLYQWLGKQREPLSQGTRRLIPVQVSARRIETGVVTIRWGNGMAAEINLGEMGAGQLARELLSPCLR